MSSYNEEHLCDLLPLYYRRLFPITIFHQWLCYGNPKQFNKREISFTLFGDIYIRYQTFDTLDDFAQTLIKKSPVKIDIGAVYRDPPRARSGPLRPVERELVFDIDMTDYDDVRTCCGGASVCARCWRLMAIACRVLDEALREDFGYRHLLWVFSGRRGVHCWVSDAAARRLGDDERGAVVEYLNVFRGGLGARRVRMGHSVPWMLRRALRIIDEYFEPFVLPEQDFLADAGLARFLGAVDAEHRERFERAMRPARGSVERWRAFEGALAALGREGKLPRAMRFLAEELKLYYAYPRLDVNVSKAMNHLLKAPFCVHPKTGMIAVPFNPKLFDKFDINQVPTISQLVDEINAYDAKTKEQDMEVDGEVGVGSKIKDYKKTSLLKYINCFNEFLRGLKTEQNENDYTF